MTPAKNTDWVTGLRDLADWLEQNPEVTIGSHIGSVMPFKACREVSVAEAREFAAQHGFGQPSEYQDEIDGVVREVAFSRSFGPLTVEVWGEDMYDGPPCRKRTLAQRVKAVFS